MFEMLDDVICAFSPNHILNPIIKRNHTSVVSKRSERSKNIKAFMVYVIAKTVTPQLAHEI